MLEAIERISKRFFVTSTEGLTMNGRRIAFIGAGNMATNMIAGLINDGYDPRKIYAAAPDADSLAKLAERFNIHTALDNKAIAAEADVIVLCVKPQIIPLIVVELAPTLSAGRPLVISIAAGVRAAFIGQKLGFDSAIVRCMPNIAAIVRSAATALYANEHTSQEQHEVAETILRSVGVTVWVDDEAKLDAVTALSGSGPAYFFLLIEAMQEAALKLGLSEDEASLLSLQTALGAARLALESPESVIALRQQVTSPGGTTERAIETLESGSLRKLVYDAMTAAATRAKELSDGLK
jgi:pyrroline-5-carboxylate reductase